MMHFKQILCSSTIYLFFCRDNFDEIVENKEKLIAKVNKQLLTAYRPNTVSYNKFLKLPFLYNKFGNYPIYNNFLALVFSKKNLFFLLAHVFPVL